MNKDAVNDMGRELLDSHKLSTDTSEDTTTTQTSSEKAPLRVVLSTSVSDNTSSDSPRVQEEIKRRREAARRRKEQLAGQHSRSIELKTSTIRQHYYPEGGYGWIILVAASIVHGLTTGLQLSFGIMLTHLEGQSFVESRSPTELVWLGSLSYSLALFVSPIVVAFCRRKSTRLTGIFGGLTASLGCLFASFGSKYHQIFISYGVIMPIGLGMCREVANLMVGQYFKRKRERVEIWLQASQGVGMAIMAALLNYGLGTLGWRRGLQSVALTFLATFLIGTLYRSASLYHPQRRAILHLKTQRRKIREKNPIHDKPPFFDFSSLRTQSVRVLVLACALASLANVSPLFYLGYACRGGVGTQSELDQQSSSSLSSVRDIGKLANSTSSLINELSSSGSKLRLSLSGYNQSDTSPDGLASKLNLSFPSKSSTGSGSSTGSSRSVVNSSLYLYLIAGCSFGMGALLSGLLVVRASADCLISRKYLLQSSLIGMAAVSTTALLLDGPLTCSGPNNVLIGMYATFLGAFFYISKMLVYERVRARFFARAWSFVSWAQSLPSLLGIPVVAYLNTRPEFDGKSGLLLTALSCLVAAFVTIFIPAHETIDKMSAKGHKSCSPRSSGNYLKDTLDGVPPIATSSEGGGGGGVVVKSCSDKTGQPATAVTKDCAKCGQHTYLLVSEHSNEDSGDKMRPLLATSISPLCRPNGDDREVAPPPPKKKRRWSKCDAELDGDGQDCDGDRDDDLVDLSGQLAGTVGASDELETIISEPVPFKLNCSIDCQSTRLDMDGDEDQITKVCSHYRPENGHETSSRPTNCDSTVLYSGQKRPSIGFRALSRTRPIFEPVAEEANAT